MKKIIRIGSVVFILSFSVLLTFFIYGRTVLPDSMKTDGNTIQIGKFFSAEIHSDDGNALMVSAAKENRSYKTEIKLFGTIPVKPVSLDITERRYVIPGGEPVGIRLKTEGVIVVGTESLLSEGKQISPAKEAGLKIGDTIISINGQDIHTNEELSKCVTDSKGQDVQISIMRDGKNIDLILSPKKSDATGEYKAGIWIRDCSSGIGTVTYIDKENGMIASLGHGIYDGDTDKLIPSFHGDMLNAVVSGYRKGKTGFAGELQGSIGKTKYADILINSEQGVYGKICSDVNADSVPVAYMTEIEEGPATIVTTIGSTKKEYDIEIEKVTVSDGNKVKNMVIKVTDEDLIEKTGGIIQGMSGSPIFQNGMLVGAVTHVFLNDPLKGYGIFAENMLEISDGFCHSRAA